MRAGVIGLGYAGLPLAVAFARAGVPVVGFDVDAERIDAIQRGESYIGDVASSEVREAVDAGALSTTTDFAALSGVDIVNICVPTPLRKTRDPDLSHVIAAVEAVAAHLRSGQLVVLESTTYPGTLDEVVRPRLEARGRRAGADFYLAFSPERVDPGSAEWTTRNIPKVVGGVDAGSTEVAVALYRLIVDTVVPVSSPRVAEMVKLLENTFRAVNIGLVNELALLCRSLGVDVWEVIDAAKTKPFGFMPFYPGPGLGGHCIPVDPFYLSWKARQSGFESRFIELARDINAGMPRHVVERVAEALNTRFPRGSRFAGPPVRNGLQVERQRHPGVAGNRHRGAAAPAWGCHSLQRSLRAHGAGRGRLDGSGRDRQGAGRRNRLRGHHHRSSRRRLRGPSSGLPPLSSTPATRSRDSTRRTS